MHYPTLISSFTTLLLLLESWEFILIISFFVFFLSAWARDPPTTTSPTFPPRSCNNSLVSLCFSVSKMPNRSIRHSVCNRPIRIALISRSSAPMVASVRPIIAVSRHADWHCTRQTTLSAARADWEKKRKQTAWKKTDGLYTHKRPHPGGVSMGEWPHTITHIVRMFSEKDMEIWCTLGFSSRKSSITTDDWRGFQPSSALKITFHAVIWEKRSGGIFTEVL